MSVRSGVPGTPSERRRHVVNGICILLSAFWGTACTHGLAALRQPGSSWAGTSAAPFSSLVFAARTDSAVIVIDLGWYGARGALIRSLEGVDAEPGDVTDVFLTHSHRDHIGAWPLLRGARFHLTEDEVPLFLGEAPHADIPSRGGEAAFGEGTPWPGELDVRPFSRDTVFSLGADSVFAYLLPGHTRGSAAYLFRRTLFAGDAFAWNWLTGLRRPAPVFSADRRRSRSELRRVLEAARSRGLQRVCNAHGKCFEADSALLRRLSR